MGLLLMDNVRLCHAWHVTYRSPNQPMLVFAKALLFEGSGEVSSPGSPLSTHAEEGHGEEIPKSYRL